MLPVFGGISGDKGAVEGSFLQIKQAVFTGTQLISAQDFTTVIGATADEGTASELSVSITTRDQASKVLCWTSITGGRNGGGHCIIARDGTAVTEGTDSGDDAVEAQFGNFNTGLSNNTETCSFMYLDSPGAGTFTYSVRGQRGAGAASFFINRSHNDSNSADAGHYVSTLIVIEIAG